MHRLNHSLHTGMPVNRYTQVSETIHHLKGTSPSHKLATSPKGVLDDHLGLGSADSEVLLLAESAECIKNPMETLTGPGHKGNVICK